MVFMGYKSSQAPDMEFLARKDVCESLGVDRIQDKPVLALAPHVADCSVVDGSASSTSYPCTCGTAECTAGQKCTASANTCQAKICALLQEDDCRDHCVWAAMPTVYGTSKLMTCQACNIAKGSGRVSKVLCYHNILWAKGSAIALHPDYYDGLTKDSKLEEFQFLLSKKTNAKTGRPICENPYDCHTGEGVGSKRHSQVWGRAQDSHVKAQLCDALKAAMQRRNTFEIEVALRRVAAFLEKSKPYSKQRRSRPNDLDAIVIHAHVLLDKLRLQAKEHDTTWGHGSTKSGLSLFFSSDSNTDEEDRVGMTGLDSDNKGGIAPATRK